MIAFGPDLTSPEADVQRMNATGIERTVRHFSGASKNSLHHHWITSSARSSSDCGMVSPSAFAAFVLTTR
jgi:hypothetical protein